ncbi:hypothetical protein [Sphingomonas sp.]|jgi:hypothetical protein|uniref:hypothetical protein n=1 Tax=Sphingomonas sp. TaxID=28214 RepID=UPI0035C7D069
MSHDRDLPVTHAQFAAALEVTRLHSLSCIAISVAVPDEEKFERAWAAFERNDAALQDIIKLFKGEND